MCGIIGATGEPDTLELLLDGLRRLEYRGYDSAGVAMVLGDGIWRARAVARDEQGRPTNQSVARLAEVTSADPATHFSQPVAGIGHTRWATHGKPTEGNAHPHLDCTGRLALVHNGIIENHAELAVELEAAGHSLVSETDTEVLAHLIEQELADGVGEGSDAGSEAEAEADAGGGLAAAVRRALGRVRGSFAVAVVLAGEPDRIVAARRSTPLIVGLTDGAALLASDVPALLGRTRRFFALDDDQVAELTPGALAVTDLSGTPVEPRSLPVDYDLEAARKDGFDDYMSKEIREQSKAVADTLLDRRGADGSIVLDEARLSDDDLRAVQKVFLVACGSSMHAAMVAKYAIEHWTRLPVEVDIASEFRYRDPVLDERTLAVGVSQSGETLDTLMAMREASRWGAKVLAVSNVVDSSLAREADGVLYTRAGPEICVAATKTYVAQVVALEILALALAQARASLAPERLAELFARMHQLPGVIDEVLGRDTKVDAVAEQVAKARDFFFLGRHVGYPIALEGALKLKELAYLRAEGYPAGELKHGPIALIEPGAVVVGVATRNPLSEKMLANVSEVRSRGATVVLVVNDGDEAAAAAADHVLWVPEVDPLFSAVVDVVPLQLLAYRLARLGGLDVDRPRNLAKTVTVE